MLIKWWEYPHYALLIYSKIIITKSKILYKNKQKRVDGFNIFHKTIEKGLNNNLSHYFYGNNEEITKKLIENLKVSYPKINIAGYYCPPYEDYKALGEKKYIGDIPPVAIGGMTVERTEGVFEAGADIISVVTDITLNKSPEKRVKNWIDATR